MARRSVSLAFVGVCLLVACGGKRTSVGGRDGASGGGGTTGGATAGGKAGSGARVGDAGEGAEAGGGESSGTGGSSGGKGGAGGGATSGAGGASGGIAGDGGATSGTGASSGSDGTSGSGGSSGTGGSSGASSCTESTADCDDDKSTCETDLTSSATCGESCSDRAACDALSGATCVNGGCSHPWVAWPIPDDSTFAEVGDGTVKDEVTGLVWQKTGSPEVRDRDGALAYCAALTTGGHTDWRLPTLMELISIVDYGRHDPAVDTDRFMATSDRYWTSTPRAERLDMWIVHFLDGRPDYATPGTDLDVRCVR